LECYTSATKLEFIVGCQIYTIDDCDLLGVLDRRELLCGSTSWSNLRTKTFILSTGSLDSTKMCESNGFEYLFFKCHKAGPTPTTVRRSTLAPTQAPVSLAWLDLPPSSSKGPSTADVKGATDVVAAIKVLVTPVVTFGTTTEVTIVTVLEAAETALVTVVLTI
jgi:hypothetical protein